MFGLVIVSCVLKSPVAFPKRREMETTEILRLEYVQGKAVCDVRGHPTQALQKAYEALDLVMKGFLPWHIVSVEMKRNESLKDSEQITRVSAQVENYSEPHA
jgi:hypothetical protein